MLRDPEADHGVLAFVSVALRQKELSGICPMLEEAAKAMEAWGAFLWQLSEDSDLESVPPKGSLFVLAEWFPDKNPWAFEELSLESASGRVVKERRSENIPNVQDYLDRVGQSHKWWLQQNEIKCFCTVLVEFEDAPAALNFYRVEDRPFDRNEVERAEQIGRLFPRLYQSIRNQVSFDLLKDIESKTLENQNLSDQTVGRALDEVCALISKAFDSFECSLFLEHRLLAPGILRQMARTSQGASEGPLAEYRFEHKGAAPWIWAENKPVRFSNLALLKTGTEVEPEKYPGLIWDDPPGIAEAVAKRLDTSKEKLPPLSYMAAPIVAGGKVLGVVRCCAAIEPPYFYAKWELKLLQLAAADIGYWWESFMRRQELDAEARAWKLFIEKVLALNAQVNEIMAKPLPDEAAIDEQCRLLSERAGAAAMVDLVEQQQRLYKLLFEMIRSRKDTEASLQGQAEAEMRFYEDLFHQLKSPIFTAAATSKLRAPTEQKLEFYKTTLLRLRAQLLKAERVTLAVQLFAELAKGREPKPELAPLDFQHLLRILVVAADDHEHLFARKRLRFAVERSGFGAWRNQTVMVDLNLVTHAINNLLDNAGKYSSKGSIVRIFVGLTNTGRFHLSVANKGLRLKPGESSECLKRGWRGREAMMVTGEGSGIGLWIVDKIMHAHNGQTLVIAPNSDDEFEVKLLLNYAK